MHKKQIFLVYSLCVLLYIGAFSGFLINMRYSNENKAYNIASYPYFSSEDSYQSLLESIFAQKQTDHSMVGYYPQIYGPSLQATYYGLRQLRTEDLLVEGTFQLQAKSSTRDINTRLDSPIR